MKRFYTLTVCAALTLLSSVPMQAQPGRAADIDALRISFITRKLNLTPEEAQKFWPVYNEFEGELKKVREEKRKLGNSVTDWAAASNEQVKTHLEKVLALDQKELDLRKTYTLRLYNVIPPYKVALLYQSVEDFRRWLLEKAQQRRPGGR